jgi:hypothetical protein
MGSLMYLMNTRSDICFDVNTLSQHLEYPIQVHLVAAKHVLRYLKGTLDHGLWYRSEHEFGLYRYLDSDWPIVFLTERELSDIVSVLAPVWSRGAAESSHVWHSV